MGSRELCKELIETEYRQLFEEFSVKTGEKWGISEAECWSLGTQCRMFVDRDFEATYNKKIN